VHTVYHVAIINQISSNKKYLLNKNLTAICHYSNCMYNA